MEMVFEGSVLIFEYAQIAQRLTAALPLAIAMLVTAELLNRQNYEAARSFDGSHPQTWWRLLRRMIPLWTLAIATSFVNYALFAVAMSSYFWTVAQ